MNRWSKLWTPFFAYHLREMAFDLGLKTMEVIHREKQKE
jgi:hypothetical protein